MLGLKPWEKKTNEKLLAEVKRTLAAVVAEKAAKAELEKSKAEIEKSKAAKPNPKENLLGKRAAPETEEIAAPARKKGGLFGDMQFADLEDEGDSDDEDGSFEDIDEEDLENMTEEEVERMLEEIDSGQWVNPGKQGPGALGQFLEAEDEDIEDMDEMYDEDEGMTLEELKKKMPPYFFIHGKKRNKFFKD